MKAAYRNISQKGLSPIFIVVGVILVIFIVIFFFGDLVAKQLIKGTPSVSTQTSTDQWVTFDNTDPKFSIKYPSDWVYTISPKGKSPQNILVINFNPKEGGDVAKINTVALRVMDKKDAKTLKEWVNKYASPSDEEVQRIRTQEEYAPFQPKNVQYNTLEGKEMAIFTMDSPVSEIAGLITTEDKYIFVLVSGKGKAPNVKEEMLRSLK